MPRDIATSLPVAAPIATNSCGSCTMQKLCLPTGVDNREISKIDQLISRRRRIGRGDALYKAAQPFSALHAVRYGHLKTFQINPVGDQQITSFQMAGDLIGMQAIGAGQHNGETVALEDTEVCEIPFGRLEDMLMATPSLMRHFHRAMSQDITREQNSMLLLGGMKAEQRLAVFLTLLSARYAARGYSPTSFALRMSREDIGNYLGLTIESVSRLFTRFKRDGLLTLDKREVTLLQPAILKQMAAGTCAA